MRYCLPLPAAVVAVVVSVSTVSPAAAQTAAPERPTLRAVALTQPLQVDGRLDEEIYRTVQPSTGFTQIEPKPGQPATERTDVWVAYDADKVYFTFRNWESDPKKIVAKEMRRDTSTMWGGDDIISFIIDTFHDGRNGYQFALNSIGGRDDGQVSNERQYNGDWNTVWESKPGRFDGGWVLEVAIPFKSLRYAAGEEQVWGFNVLRTNRSKNELSFLAPTPPARGQQGIEQTSLAATLTGLRVPSGAKNIELKPFAIATASATRTAPKTLKGDVTKDIGGDFKYGITQNMTADLTVRTDFAQVEADTQQVNLTRFSLFFPEKREFFLENQGTFQFGSTTAASSASDTPLLFYSRRIGLEQGRTVPLQAGGRVTGRAGRYTVGAMNIQAGDDDALTSGGLPTNFTVARVKRDILRRSFVGLIMTERHGTTNALSDNAAYGVDGTFAFFRNLTITTYAAKTETHGGTNRQNGSVRAQLDYNADRYGVQLEQLNIGRNFNPGVGFVRRTDIEKSYALARFSPRPKKNRYVRKFYFQGSLAYVENGAGRLDTRNQDIEFDADLQNGDKFILYYDGAYEHLSSPFRIATGVTLPVGSYTWDTIHVGYNRAGRRRASGQFFTEYGTFYSGHKTAFGVSSGRVSVTPKVAFEPSYSVNKAELLQGSFTTQLAGLRAIYTPSARMFASAFLQFNSSTHAVSSNVRLRWEYQPGSELFVVFNEERDTTARSFPEPTNRAFVVKVNRLFRM